MDIITSLAVIAFAALIHASFQLSVSVLTLLSGHAIGIKRSQAKLMRLTTGFVTGAGVMTILLLSSMSFKFLQFFGAEVPQFAWAIGCVVLIIIAVLVCLLYYKRGKGTMLWIPRGFANYLNHRTKSTRLSAEAFGLGLSSVLGELLFIVGPLLIASLTLIQLPSEWQLAGIFMYSAISMFSLIVVWVLIGSGHNLGRIQRWREKNKSFLQFSAGAGLVVLALFVYVTQIIGNGTGLK